MYKKIYFNEKALYITTNLDAELSDLDKKESTEIWKSFEESTVDEVIKTLKKEKVQTGIIVHEDIDEVLETFENKVLFIQAAGGLIYIEKEILLIYRRGKWDLPKGKLDENENLYDAAIREVAEETGITDIVIEEKIGSTYHTYYQGNDFILKESHWYLMKAHSKEELKPQFDEDIEICEWVPIDKLSTYLQNTHPSIKDVIQEYLKKLK
ncbi:MAG TPA: NUDIX domain-containing protein [Chitinophagaceae bacterium]|nr:NUDIX domain-containing protein [Chitinophagaceae bacterium]